MERESDATPAEAVTYSTVEVADRLGIPYSVLDRWCRRGWIDGMATEGPGRWRTFTEAQALRAREIRDAIHRARTELERAGLDTLTRGLRWGQTSTRKRSTA